MKMSKCTKVSSTLKDLNSFRNVDVLTLSNNETFKRETAGQIHVPNGSLKFDYGYKLR